MLTSDFVIVPHFFDDPLTSFKNKSHLTSVFTLHMAKMHKMEKSAGAFFLTSKHLIAMSICYVRYGSHMMHAINLYSLHSVCCTNSLTFSFISMPKCINLSLYMR